jgi:succinate-acetate transporter protein
MGMKYSDRISGRFWLFFSLVVLKESYHLGLGTLHSPQVGFHRFMASLALGVFSIMLLLCTFGKKQKGETLIFNLQRVPKVLYILIALLAYSLLLDKVGYLQFYLNPEEQEKQIQLEYKTFRETMTKAGLLK